MRTDIRGINVRPSEAMIYYTERCLFEALNHVRHRVQSVVVRLVDINGPRGGVCKRCKLVLTLSSGESLVIENTDTCFYRTISCAAGRAKRSIGQRLRQARTDRRRRG